MTCIASVMAQQTWREKCQNNHVRFYLSQSESRKTIEKPLKELLWNQQVCFTTFSFTDGNNGLSFCFLVTSNSDFSILLEMDMSILLTPRNYLQIQLANQIKSGSRSLRSIKHEGIHGSQFKTVFLSTSMKEQHITQPFK